MKERYIFDDVTFYVSDVGDGIVSKALLWVSKFKDNKLVWNKGFKPEKINEEFLAQLI